jgi:HEAT repeat protein
MAHVFLSYDREDRDFAEVVQAKLERAGHETSMDLDILNAGDDWQTTLDLAIRRSDAIVVIMAPEARASDYVAYEWAFALGAGVNVIPLELRTTEFPPRLDGLHRLDFTGRSRPWDALLTEVARAEASNPASSVLVDPRTPAAVKHAVRAIDSLVPEERHAGVNTLAQTDHPAALEALTRALDHPVRDVRIAAASLFPDRTNPTIVPGLIDAYLDEAETWFKRGQHGDSPYPLSLFQVIDRLGALAAPALVNALKRLGPERKHYEPTSVILSALARTRSAGALVSLQEALQNESSYIRCEAAKALGQLGDPGGVTALRSSLADRDPYVRTAAAKSLGLLKDVAAVSDLIASFQDDASSVRAAAAVSLGKIGDRSSVQALIVGLGDEKLNVRAAAVEAAVSHLRMLLNQAGTDLNDTLDWNVMVALVRLHDAESLTPIANRLIDVYRGYQQSDIYGELARYGDEGVQVLLRLLSGLESESYQSEIANALASVQTPEAVSTLKAWRRKRS